MQNACTVIKYIDKGKCKNCKTYPRIAEFEDGSGHIYCNCCLNIIEIMKSGYNYGHVYNDKQAAINKWCKDHITEVNYES